MIANMNSSDLKGRSNSNVLGSGLSASGGTIYIGGLPGLESRLTIILSPQFGADLLGCQSQYNRKGLQEKKKMERIN